MSIDDYTDILKTSLLRKITIKYDNGKVYKTGYVKNFDIKQFYIKLMIEIPKKSIKTIELPYPYKMSISNNNIITLNYHLTSLYSSVDSTFFRIKTINRKKNNKLYDSLVHLILS